MKAESDVVRPHQPEQPVRMSPLRLLLGIPSGRCSRVVPIL